MNAMLKPMAGPRADARVIQSKDGKTLTGSYTSRKQANQAATILTRRREALAYLAKR